MPAEEAPYGKLEMPRVHADLTLPTGARDDLDHVPAGTTPQHDVPSTHQLAPDGAGTKTDTTVFVAKVAPDGSIDLHDKADLEIHWAVPTVKHVLNGIAEWYLSDKGPDGKRGKRTLENDVQIESGGVDGTGVIIPVFRGHASVDDWIARRTVGDPYASRKLAYLDSTRDERAQIGAKHREQQLAHTIMIVRGNLQRAWASTTNVAERKQALFELWDEVVEPASDRGDDADELLARAARDARAQVIAFIRAHLPPGGADAYTTDELAAFNAKKQSTAAFAPYAP